MEDQARYAPCAWATAVALFRHKHQKAYTLDRYVPNENKSSSFKYSFDDQYNIKNKKVNSDLNFVTTSHCSKN